MYNDKLIVDQQISSEESIASTIRAFVDASENSQGDQDYTLTDEDCQKLGQIILGQVLYVFRPDLIDNTPVTR
jgi:hypothetical protein